MEASFFLLFILSDYNMLSQFARCLCNIFYNRGRHVCVKDHRGVKYCICYYVLLRTLSKTELYKILSF